MALFALRVPPCSMRSLRALQLSRPLHQPCPQPLSIPTARASSIAPAPRPPLFCRRFHVISRLAGRFTSDKFQAGPRVLISQLSTTSDQDVGSSAIGFKGDRYAEILGEGARKGMADERSMALRKRGGKVRKMQSGVINVHNSWNNTMVSISDINYQMKGWVSGGTCGFKKSKRSSAFAKERVLEEAFNKARQVHVRPCSPLVNHAHSSGGRAPMQFSHAWSRLACMGNDLNNSFYTLMPRCGSQLQLGIRQVMLNMTGPAINLRKPLFRQIREQTAIRVMKIRHADHVPHGGCRPRKSRRRRYRTRSRRR